MPPWVNTIVSVIAAFLASSGFWAYIMKKTNNRSAENKLLIGLAHDRIVNLSMEYLSRESKSMTQTEYSNLHDYLYMPYEELCDEHDSGYGIVKKLMEQIEKNMRIVPDVFEV